MEAAPHPWPAIGSLMLRDGYVSKEELEDILRAQHDTPQQRISGWRLGELLVERGLMTQGQVAQLVAEQYELPYTELDPSLIDPSVVHLLSAEMVDRFSALPVETLPDGSLLLAVSDPATVLFSDELRRALGRPLRFTVVAPDAMEAAVASVRSEAQPERPSLSLAEWPSGAPSFGFANDAAADDSEPTPARSTPPLGTLLVRDGLLTEAELESALAEQRESDGKRLGEILVDRGALTRADVARVVAEQYELPFVDLASFELDHRVGALLPLDIAQRYSALPLDFLADGSLRVAVADPTKILAPEEILAVLGARLSFAVADPEAVEAALEQLREQTSAVSDSWASIAPVGPPVSRFDEHVSVDASDLIIVPAEEAPVELESIERRGDQAAEHMDELALATPEPASFTDEPEGELALAPEPAPESDASSPEPEQPAEEPLAAGELELTDASEPVAEAKPKKRRRGWFRRRKHDDEPTLADAAESPEAVTTAAAPETSDPIAGLLLAGEAAGEGHVEADETSPRATEQAAVLRLWIAGDETPADSPQAEAEVEAVLDAAEDAFTEAYSDAHTDAPEADALAPEETLDAEPESHVEADAEPATETESSATSDTVTADESTTTDAGLPEFVDETFADARSTESEEPLEAEAPSESWNVFAPAAAADLAEAQGAGEDAPPAELHGDVAFTADAHDEHHDAQPEPFTPAAHTFAEATTDAWDAPFQVDSADDSEDHHSEPALEATARAGAVEEETQAPVGARHAEVEDDPFTDDVVEASQVLDAEATGETALDEPEADAPTFEPDAWRAPVVSAWEQEQEQEHAAEAFVHEDEELAETAEPVEAERPSWASWEPAEGAADPWTAADGDDDSVEAVDEPWATVQQEDVELEADLAETPLAHESSDDAWLAEIEPDSPASEAAPWELEDAPVAASEAAGDEAGYDVTFAHAPVEEEMVTSDAVVEPVAVELAVVHEDRGTLAPLVERATALGASTVHFSAQESGVVVRARIDGVLRKLDTVTGQARFELARELGLAAQSGSLAGGHVTALPTPHGDTVTVRFRPSGDASTLDTLSLDPADREAFERALGHSFGLVLVAGPSGSGQAATLSAALHHLASGDRAVMTIEDPILHVVSGADQVAVDHSAGRGYADGLRTLLSADPDVVLVGELADEETARLAVDAATGQLVVTTVLAQTAVGALDRLALLGVDTDLVASTLSLVVAQRLVRRLCDHCREGYYASAADAVALRRPEDEIGRRLLARGTGCAECGDTGFSGTIGAYEVLSPNDEVRALVAANAPAAELERAARLAGKRTLADDAIRLCLEGLTTVSEVQRVLGRALL